MSKPGAKPYKWIRMPGHPNATQNGYVQEHRIVAEQIVGRVLDQDEAVHHIDRNTENNSIENLMVFASRRDHNAFHLGAPAWSDDGLIWHASSVLHTSECQYCGKKFLVPKGGRKFCSTECMENAKKNISEERITEIQRALYECNGNFSKAARLFGVSSSGIAKLLKTHGLKYRSQDYKSARN